MNFFNRVFEQVRDLFLKMSMGQKLSLCLLLGTVVLSIVLMFAWTTSEGLVPLYYSDIDISAVVDITEKLNELNIEHELKKGIIYVPRANRYLTLMKLIQADVIPKGDDYFAFLGETRLSDTAQKTQMLFNKAMEKALADLIVADKNISSATVLFQQSNGSRYVFESEQPPMGATVRVGLKSGSKLDKAQLLGIARSVANVVEGLEPQEVQISDTDSRYYTVPDSDDITSAIADQRDLKIVTEIDYRKKISPTLQVMYPNAQLLIEVRLDTKRKTSEVHTVGSPDESKISSTIDEKEKSTGSETAAPPGPYSELRTGNTPGMEKSSDRTVKEELPKDWNKTDEFEESLPDPIKAITVAVVIPYSQAIIPKGATEAPTDPALQQAAVDAHLQDVKEVVQMAVGEEDDTNITVVTNDLRGLPQPEPLPTTLDKFLAFSQANWFKAALIFFVFVAFFMVFNTLKRSLPELAIPEEELLEEEAVPDLLPRMVLDDETIKTTQMKERIEETAAEDPEMVTDLVVRWIKQRS